MELKLGICSYGSFLKVAIYNGKRFYNASIEYLNQEEILFKVINKLLKKCNGNFKDFSDICFVNGPGRFTGIRISYTFAGIYSVFSGAKLHSVTTFDCLVYNLYEKLKLSNTYFDIAVLLRAFKDEFFLAYYKLSDGKLSRILDPLWLKRYQVIKELLKFDGYVIGDKEEFKDIYSLAGQRCIVAADNISLIKPENVIKSAFYFRHKNIKPLYLKPAKYEIVKRVYKGIS